MISLFNFLAFYTGWFACVGGASHGWLAFGPLVVTTLIGLHLYVSPHPMREMRLIAAVGVLGWVIDTLQGLAGVLAYGANSPLPWMCPPWLAAVWMLFATTLNGSMSWLSGRYWLAALLGGIAGPVSYAYGARLGAVAMPDSPVSLVVLAVVWAVTMPVLLRLTAVLAPRATAASRSAAPRYATADSGS